MEEYLYALERTRAIVTEVRGAIEDAIAYQQSQGLLREDAERVALGHFGSAGSLARALRRSHGRAPVPLRMVAVVLALVGIGGLAILGSMAQRLVWLATHNDRTDSVLEDLLHAPGYYLHVQSWLILLIPATIILVCAGGSLLLATLVLRGGRPRWRSIGLALGLVALLDVGGCLLLWPQLSPRHSASLADWTFPGLQRLRAAGLVSYPDAQQPTGPVRVDYLAVDSGGMYVAYTIPDSLHSRTDWDPQLFDDRGKEYVGLGDGGSGVGTLEQLMPWRPAVHAYKRFQSLPPTARTAVVRVTVFDPNMHTGFAMPVVTTTAETVRLSLHLQGLTRVRAVHPRGTSTVHGISLSIGGLSNGPAGASLTYHVSAPARLPVSGDNPATLTGQDGRPIGLLLLSDECMEERDRSARCTSTLSFAPQPRGSRIVLTIPRLGVYWPRETWLAGPWRLALTIP